MCLICLIKDLAKDSMVKKLVSKEVEHCNEDVRKLAEEEDRVTWMSKKLVFSKQKKDDLELIRFSVKKKDRTARTLSSRHANINAAKDPRSFLFDLPLDPAYEIQLTNLPHKRVR